jgi:hypothetical protein
MSVFIGTVSTARSILTLNISTAAVFLANDVFAAALLARALVRR